MMNNVNHDISDLPVIRCKSVCFYKYAHNFEHFMEFVHYKCFIIIIIIIINY